MIKTIKTIKTKKRMTFRELMEYIFENNIHGKRFASVSRQDMEDRYISVSSLGKITFRNIVYNSGELYEVEVEEEITEDTEFESVVINTEEFIYSFRHISIEEARDKLPKAVEIFARIDGRLQLVWERDSDD